MGRILRPKTCPTCEQKTAIATKICKSCGYDFYNAKRLIEGCEPKATTTNGFGGALGLGPKSSALGLGEVDSDELEGGRRTRVQRAKPNFYDSRQFDKKKKRRRRKGKKNGSETDKKLLIRPRRETSLLNQRGFRPKPPPVFIDEDEDIMSMLSEEKQKWATKLLDEINRKLCLVQWKPPS